MATFKPLFRVEFITHFYVEAETEDEAVKIVKSWGPNRREIEVSHYSYRCQPRGGK